MMDINKELIKNPVLLSVFSKDYYNESIFKVLKDLKDNRICYVTLNKTANSLEDSFKLHKAYANNLFFIDAVSQGIGKAKEKENVVFVSSPAALTELSVAIGQALKAGIFDIVLLDSLSTLTIYSKSIGAERFTANTIAKIRSESKKGVLTCLEDDFNTNLMKSSSMSVDKVLKFNEFYESLRKKKTNMAIVTSVFLVLLGSLSIVKFGANSESTVTGFSVFENASLNTGTLFIFILLLFISGLILINKKFSMNPIPNSTLLNIKPSKKDPIKFRSDVKSKLSSWFEKTNHDVK